MHAQARQVGDLKLALHYRENANTLCAQIRALGDRGARVAREVELSMIGVSA